MRVEFCGEWFDVDGEKGFDIGREGDLSVDDNPYLHRTFLRIHEAFGLWWLSNVGSLLSATVSDETGQVQAWLAPGARLPIVFRSMQVMFSAGSTTYEFSIHSDQEFFETGLTVAANPTTTQRMLIVALAEQVFRHSMPGRGSIPTSAEAAARLGWSMTTFNRKLDNVCEKLDKIGVHGLRGGPGALALHRRARLVEYAVASHLVGTEDLVLLDLAAASAGTSTNGALDG
jgi:hypothetical protein